MESLRKVRLRNVGFPVGLAEKHRFHKLLHLLDDDMLENSGIHSRYDANGP